MTRKLIEVALPLPEINDASAYDKMPGIGAHPKGIHHWWARLPLPVARAVLFASVVDDPSSHPEKFPTEEAQEAERERLFGIVRRMMSKQLHKHPEIYAEAREEMLKYCDGKLPPVLDPFAGGGSIPLEAARLGFEAYAADLNPVAVLLNKCNLEIVPRWANHPPVNPETREKIGGTEGGNGADGLAADVHYYGQVILERARKRIGHLYPPVKVTAEMAAEHPHLQPYVGKELPVIAWIWARTVPSPNPAARGAHVPLMSTFWLSSKKGSEAWLEPVVDRAQNTWRFLVRTGAPKDREAVKAGTKTGRAQFRCLLTGDPISDDHIKKEGRAGRLGQRLVAIVADTGRGRVYVPATTSHEAVAGQGEPSWRPGGEIPPKLTGGTCALYGLTKMGDLFTPRQLTAMVALSDLIWEVRADVRQDALAAGLSEADADAYTAAIVTFLALALDRCADFNNALCRWEASRVEIKNLFARQAIPMVWDFAEGNPLGSPRSGFDVCLERVVEGLEHVYASGSNIGHARPIDAARPWDEISSVLISTDPPYYDNIGYAALSDFFYVWLRRTIGDLYPDLFATILVPKEPELVAAPERFDGDKRKAKEHFEQGFRRAFAILREKMDQRFPLTVYYAFKQDDVESGEDGEENEQNEEARIDRTTGWETMLEALIGTGFQITATWPVRASQKWRMNAMETNALASYIVIACRPRPEGAPQTDRRSFVAELKRELPVALRRLRQGNIAPVDFAQAAIGPGMAIYSKYRRVLEASGRPMTVRTALGLINQVLTEVLSEQEDEFDNDTRWAIAWFEQHGFFEGDFGNAELLSKAKATSVNGLVEAGIVATRAGGVRLLRPEELKKDWDPATDKRFTVWEATHHLLRLYWYEKAGEEATALLLQRLGSYGELARELAYRLYNVCEKRNWSQEAQGYNALVVGWPELARLSRIVVSTKQLTLETT
ncbi:hypothetical protein EG19_06490 [Thermoanaerobaculum aquaticum]|uniref:DUF1156 domain-containing protein n=1 Tax=Thermoanaerobaculum aquaticum TaxID=1312852 RepID=A0A062XVK2_9BACT|nr:DUF1156 domain-containing protein [Thermoanaerobaculum aquaticum]KDA53394.1 hypothetical protein EG19_06490 [Thermoanaerobaculum aquaticum]